MDPSFYSSCVWDKESLGISRTISENSGTFEYIPHKKKEKKLPPSPPSAREKGVILRKKGGGWIKGGFTVDELAKKK